MKKLLQTYNRPIVWINLYIILGIIGGTIKLQELYGPLFLFFTAIFLLNLVIIYYFKSIRWVMLFGIAIGMTGYFTNKPMHTQLEEVMNAKTFVATIEDVYERSYATQYVLDNVEIIETDKTIPVRFKIQGESEDETVYKVGDQVIIEGRVEQLPYAYNPSDMDYGVYLRGKGIGALIDIGKMKVIDHRANLIHKVAEEIEDDIEYLFDGRDKGIVKSLILGDKSSLDNEVKNLYNQLGIGHVLAISGLHVGIIYGILWWLTRYIRCNYFARNLIIIILLWGYCLLTGLSISAVRATTIVTLILIAKMLWQELDVWIGLGWISTVILLYNPYLLFQVGFQLSFVAYSAILLFSEVIRVLKYTYKLDIRWVKMIKFVGPSIWISIWISPILAYHFYEIPILASLFNLFILILIEVLMPLILCTLILGEIGFWLAYHLAGGICLVFRLIEGIGEMILQIPLATVVIGRPKYSELMLYYIGIGGMVFVFIKHLDREFIRLMGGVALVSILFVRVYPSKNLEITHLYVGQGDSTVMITPTNQVMVIDGGVRGKGKTVERFIHYKGYNKIDVAIVTHAHEDHIGGIIEVIEDGMYVEKICMPDMPDNEWVSKLEQLCLEKGIEIAKLSKGSHINIGDISIKFFAPNRQNNYEDMNAFSAVALVEYGDFEALYTGDLPMAQEYDFCDQVGDIDVLKIGHHGSATSTSTKLLEQTLPEYGMISCGKNNRYNHPSPLVVERLEEYNVEAFKTYEQGAITIKTDGKQLKIDTEL